VAHLEQATGISTVSQPFLKRLWGERVAGEQGGELASHLFLAPAFAFKLRNTHGEGPGALE
jgi:hypothetical protein